MAAVNILDIQLAGENPSHFLDPFRIQIDFECIQELRDDLDWKVLYVGSAESEQHDQVLTSVLVGPIPVGRNRFILEAPPPDHTKIPDKDVVGITALLLTCSYYNQEFVRVGYYVNNEYDSLELRENPPKTPDFSRIARNVLIQKPRVTRFPINWDSPPDPNDPSLLSAPMVMPLYEGNSMFAETSNSSMAEAEPVEEEIVIPQEKPFLVTLPDFTQYLSAELARKIFQFLSVPDLAISRGVSKKWKDIIDVGIEWKNVNLSDLEWSEDEQLNTNMLNFVVKHASADLHSLKISETPINDQMLYNWLSKCGSKLDTLDVSFCQSLTTRRSIDIIIETCPVISNLNVENVGTDEAVESDQVAKICSKYQSTLRHLSVHGLTNESLRIIAELCGTSLRSISVPLSDVNDEGILDFVQRCPQLTLLGLELSEVSPQTVKTLRSMRSWVVRSSHWPDDFVVEITPEESVVVTILFKHKHVHVTLAELDQIRKNVAFPTKLGVVEERLVYDGNLGEAAKAFKDAGFNEVTISHAESEEDIEDIDDDLVCDVCKKPEGERDIVTCERCDTSYHTTCLKTPLTEVPLDGWFCEQCSETEHVTKKRKV